MIFMGRFYRPASSAGHFSAFNGLLFHRFFPLPPAK
jgi:hypothetical protein